MSKHQNRIELESLEGRQLFATFIVTTTADTGTGSLRDAITKANSAAGADVIQFKIGSGLKTIAPAKSLPQITGPTTLDATTQPGYAGKPIIELKGTSAGAGTFGLALVGGSSVVKGFVINRFGAGGMLIITKGGNTVQNCWIGVDATGGIASPNNANGIIVQSPNNLIGGRTASARNVISGNAQHGIQVYQSTASGNVISGNYIGTDALGNKAIANTKTGVSINGAAKNMVGGTRAGEGNVISGNKTDGVLIINTGATGNVVAGNLIGTNAAGKAKIGNGLYGVEISQPSNTVGGTTAYMRNVISGNANSGIALYQATGSKNVVIGNYLGTDITGQLSLGNTWRGIDITNGSSNNIIGGATAAERNVISGNLDHGLLIYQGSGNLIKGNTIGFAADNTKALPNTKDGIHLVQTNLTTIQSNRIGHNGAYGIHNGTSTNTKVTGNTIINDLLYGVVNT